jgi:hypothetical protein
MQKFHKRNLRFRPSLSKYQDRLRTIRLDEHSMITEIDPKFMINEVAKLGGRGEVLILLDIDNIIRTVDMARTLDRIDRYVSFLKKKGVQATKIACMNDTSFADCQASEKERALQDAEYICNLYFVLMTLQTNVLKYSRRCGNKG